jgi:Fur family peroxide stress response transcriptional regulator
MQSVQTLCERLRDEGKKVTPQRRLIYQALCDKTTHPRAEDIYEEVRAVIPDISLATVYKTLRELVEMGELLEIKHDGQQSRFDPRTDQHNHLVCTSCGRMEDVLQQFPNIELNETERRNFQIKQSEVVFWGTCPDC